MINQHQKEIVLEHIKSLNPIKVAIFGSYARGDNHEGSDLDVLVHLNYSYPTSLLKIAHVSQNLSGALGIPVDIVTEKSISMHLRPHIEKDLIYIFQ
jgi:hypothetical protein